MVDKKYLATLALAFMLAYITTIGITKKIVYSDKPRVREEFQTAIIALPNKIIQAPQQFTKVLAKTFTSPAQLPNQNTTIGFIPPPATNPSYQPPANAVNPNNPANNPYPTSSGQNRPTSIPTAILTSPANTNPLNPSPTTPPNSSPSNTPVPTQPPTANPTETPVVARPPDTPTDGRTAQLLSLLNSARTQNNPPLAPLRYDARLEQGAQSHLQDMHDNKYFAHTSPSGRDDFSFAREAGYPYAMGGVIAAGHGSAGSAFSAWMQSPGHHAILMDARAKAVGFGVIDNRCGSSLQLNPCWAGTTGGE